MKVEVVRAAGDVQHRVTVELQEGASVGDAIAAAIREGGIPEADMALVRCGVFGKLVEPETPLNDGDRVELYRPLTVSAQDARRRRAAKRGKSAVPR
jgi:putative ubiquitin-RnfH superfamily antitoxin RatB of RatAB toxin-antitoxin module